MEELKSMIEKFDVISFDVFDTLLLRPYLRPTDLFRRVGGMLFAKERIDAECAARMEMQAAGHEEVTVDQIYARLPKWQHLKERELEEERRCLVANPEVVEVFNAAKLTGKKCVIASDMYLPRQFLESVLREKGIDGWHAFYLSCDCGVQKASGRMFELLVKECGVPPCKILHIGDDVCADVRAPEKLGIGTWWIPKMRDVFFAENQYALEFVNKHPDAAHEDFVGALILAWQIEKSRAEYCSRQKLACLFGGSVVFAYTRWMIEDARSRGIKRFLFVARDGYTPKRVVELLAPDFEVDYIFAPRSVSKLVREGAAVRADYLEYVKSLSIDPETTAIVDGNTEFFSSQRLIDACLSAHCMGYYFIRTNNYGRSASYYYFTRGCDVNIYMFLESLYCAPTLPIRDVQDGRPAYFECESPYERIRAEEYQQVSAAVVRVSKLFDYVGLLIEPKVLLEWLDAFMQGMPLVDKISLSHTKNSLDIEHTKYHSIQFVQRQRHGWKRYFRIPMKVVHHELVGYVLEEYVRVLGVIPCRLRYRIAHEEGESPLIGDLIENLRCWVRDEFRLVRGLRKLYRRIRHHGEFA